MEWVLYAGLVYLTVATLFLEIVFGLVVWAKGDAEWTSSNALLVAIVALLWPLVVLAAIKQKRKML